MPGPVQIPVFTFNVFYDPNVLSRTQYVDQEAGIGAIAFITTGAGQIDGQDVLEGYGVIILAEGYEVQSNFFVNNNGYLVANGPDANLFSLNANGELCY